MNKLTVLLFISYNFFAYSQESIHDFYFIVDTETLNVRAEATSESKKREQVHLGDTLLIKKELKEWYEIIYYSEGSIDLRGYVSKKYIRKKSKGETIGERMENKKADMGFMDGFWYYGVRIFFVIFLLVAGYFGRKYQVKDSRYKKGYRDTKKPFGTTTKVLFYTFALTIPLAVIAGLICLIF